jgi:hypothetical protein
MLNCRWMGLRGISTRYCSDAGFVERASAVGTDLGQRRFVDLIDVGGGLAMSLGSVVRAGLATGPLRLGLRRPPGEGGGLAFAIPLCLFEEAGQALDLGFELVGAAPQVGDEAVAFPAARAGRALHTRIVAEGACLRGFR